MKVTSCETDCKLLDLKTRYDVEIPAVEENDSFKITLKNDQLKVEACDKSGACVPLGSWDVSRGVHLESMTTEYRDGVLYIRLPKGDEVRPRELQYSETIVVTPNGN